MHSSYQHLGQYQQSAPCHSSVWVVLRAKGRQITWRFGIMSEKSLCTTQPPTRRHSLQWDSDTFYRRRDNLFHYTCAHTCAAVRTSICFPQSALGSEHTLYLAKPQKTMQLVLSLQQRWHQLWHCCVGFTEKKLLLSYSQHNTLLISSS